MFVSYETLTQQAMGLRSQQQLKQDPPQPQTHALQTSSQPEEKPNPRNTIVRRTIIIPLETEGLPSDIQNLLRKESTKRRRSASAASTHPIQYRAPTPPPKNGPGVRGKRFSTNVSVNPMPGTSSSHNTLEIPGAQERAGSGSAQIGRLIETLSKGTDSGSSNILPYRPQSHATSQSIGSSPEMQWTVEERLNWLLASMN